MDNVSKWFSPLTNREVLTILAACAVAITVGIVALLLPLRRRLRTWAASQGFELTKLEGWGSNRRWWNTEWRVTVRAPSGLTRVGIVRLVGFLPFPNRVDVRWEGESR